MSTNIAWTNETWNPVTGCSHVSPGCEHCYAETLSLRRGWSKKPWTAQNAAANVKLHPERLEAPLRWRGRRMVFVNSMSDLFHELVPWSFIDQVFSAMQKAKRHTFQILTKRAENARAFAASWAMRHDILPNVWLGVSVEDQRRADERIPLLLDTPAAVRFVSAEPLLGPVNLRTWHTTCRTSAETPWIDWLIIGGESGPDHRPMNHEWAESLAEECAASGIACFVKQDSGPRPGKQGRLSDALWARKEFPRGVTFPHPHPEQP